MSIDLKQLQSLAAVALPLVKQFGGSNPTVASLAGVVSTLLGQGGPAAVPAKQQIDGALADAISARKKAMSDARDALKPRG